jgi:hypothetical protein
VRSVWDDPLGDRHARGFIDEAQFATGREFHVILDVLPRQLDRGANRLCA